MEKMIDGRLDRALQNTLPFVCSVGAAALIAFMTYKLFAFTTRIFGIITHRCVYRCVEEKKRCSSIDDGLWNTRTGDHSAADGDTGDCDRPERF